MNDKKIYLLSLTALFAALSYAVFSFLQIKLPLGADMTSIHLGNAVVVLASLIIGGPLGGISGAVGMSIGDLFDPFYFPLVPKTFICKLIIGLISGFIAHTLGHITESDDQKHIKKYVLLSSSAGLLVNVFLDPFIGYYYKILVLGKNAADLSLKINILSSFINAFVSVIVVYAVYSVLRPQLIKSGLLLHPKK